MKIIKVSSEDEERTFDLFCSPEEDERRRQRIREYEFAHQDQMALKSEVFKKILDSEIKDDPEERMISTNSPKSKTRNALMTRSVYQTQEEWEENLLTNPYYSLNG